MGFTEAAPGGQAPAPHKLEDCCELVRLPPVTMQLLPVACPGGAGAGAAGGSGAGRFSAIPSFPPPPPQPPLYKYCRYEYYRHWVTLLVGFVKDSFRAFFNNRA